MAGWNELLIKRDKYARGSDKWRELDRAALFIQGDNGIRRITKQLGSMRGWNTKTEFQREDYARDRVSREYDALAKRQKEKWRRRDIMQIRDDLRTTHGD